MYWNIRITHNVREKSIAHLINQVDSKRFHPPKRTIALLSNIQSWNQEYTPQYCNRLHCEAANQQRRHHKYEAVNTAGFCVNIYVISLTPLDSDVDASKDERGECGISVYRRFLDLWLIWCWPVTHWISLRDINKFLSHQRTNDII